MVFHLLNLIIQNMTDDFIKLNYKDRSYIIYKGESLKTLLQNQELLSLPLNIWKEIFEKKDGICYYGLMYKVLQEKIKYYDTSLDVNSFYYNDKQYWYDKNTRVGLQNLANCSSENITLILDDNILELNLDKAKQFLSQLEVYAGKCYINTAKHLKSIKDLKTIEDLINYDYTSGYPSKIILEIE